ncbi:MAG: OadG family transporter subunit [Verrucomicrobiota bacterium]
MHPAAYSLLAAAEEPNNLTILIGFAFVIVVLAILAIVTQAMGIVFIKRTKAELAAATAKAEAAAKSAEAAVSKIASDAAPAAATAASVSNAIDGELVAIIAAAVHATLGEPHEILSITSVTDRQWASEGRREIFRSHKVR